MTGTHITHMCSTPMPQSLVNAHARTPCRPPECSRTSKGLPPFLDADAAKTAPPAPLSTVPTAPSSRRSVCAIHEHNRSHRRAQLVTLTSTIGHTDEPGGCDRCALGGKYWSSVDAREPQNPTKSETYQGHLQGVLYIV
eukprot:1194254-Prorocentrum_minimum.AAC.3